MRFRRGGRLRIFGLAAGFLASVALAQTPDASEATNGDFGAKLLVTDDLQGFWTAWDQPDNPHVMTTSQITRKKPVYAVIVFHDCKAGADGKCDLSVKFEMTGPDGRPYGDSHEGVAWNGSPAPNHNLQASPASMGFILDPQDRLGRYTIIVTLTDKIAGKSLHLNDVVTAVDEPTAQSPTA